MDRDDDKGSCKHAAEARRHNQNSADLHVTKLSQQLCCHYALDHSKLYTAISKNSLPKCPCKHKSTNIVMLCIAA